MRTSAGTVLGGQEVTYLQSQNGNLFNSQSEDSEFESLLEDIERDIPWASEALGGLLETFCNNSDFDIPIDREKPRCGEYLDRQQS